ncbi:MAG: hypothetical protein IK019_01770, partial [Clostridia bacterium]|nr:hypothetical protein [Clostridia bacterium]
PPSLRLNQMDFRVIFLLKRALGTKKSQLTVKENAPKTAASSQISSWSISEENHQNNTKKLDFDCFLAQRYKKTLIFMSVNYWF